LTESQIETAAETLALAFFNYPVMTYVFPDEEKRSVQLPLVQKSTIEYGLSQFAEYNPIIYKVMNALSIFMTKRLLRTAIPFYIGEMILVARNNGS